MVALERAQRIDCKQMLKRLIKYMNMNMKPHESVAKAGKELMGLLGYLLLSTWLQVADAITRPLVYVQVPEVAEIINKAHARIDKTKPMEGESPIEEIIMEQNLPDMAHL